MTLPPIEALDEIDSTNAEARRRAEAGATGPVWIAAARQTSALRFDFEHATVELEHLYGYTDADWKLPPAPTFESSRSSQDWT